MGFARFMASPLGRGGRIVFGLTLIAWGIGVVGGGLAERATIVSHDRALEPYGVSMIWT